MLRMSTKFLNEIINPEIKFLLIESLQTKGVFRSALDKQVRNINSSSKPNPIVILTTSKKTRAAL